MNTTLRVSILLALLLFSSLLTGCGNMGAPLPPLIQIPVPVSDLAIHQFGKFAQLSWTLPKLNTDGSSATTVATVEIYRLVTDHNQPTPDSKAFAQSQPWKSIPKQILDTYPQGMKLSFSDTFEEFGAHEVFQSSLHYALKVVNKKKQDAGLSNIVSLSVIPLPVSPENVRVISLGEQHTELGWDIPTLNNDGTPVNNPPSQFNVYRRVDPQSPETRLNPSPLQEGRFKDESIELGRSYVYSVRPVVETQSGSVEGEDSQPLEVTNADTYPPKPPAEITAISSGQGISLVWLPNTEVDLAGYWVYRSGQDKNFQRLQDQLLTTASIIDKSVEKGQTYFYRVRAVDLKGNESEFSEEASDVVE